ncbi:HAMP domain-containing methyl-accepting chemotaxis protein [Methanospirillum lacunae]|nr:methyl-accepting chemotaxis protein [Methanospirillum lacunae]
MIQLDTISMSKKLLILIIIGVFAIMFTGVCGLFTAGEINSEVNQIYKNKYTHSMLAYGAYSDMLNYAIGGYTFTLASTVSEKQQIFQTKMDPFGVSLLKRLDDYSSIEMNDNEKGLIEEIKKSSAEYLETTKQVNSLTLQGKDEEATQLRIQSAIPKRNLILTDLQKLMDDNNQTSNQCYIDANQLYSQGILIIVVVIIFCTIILLFIAWLIAQNINRRFGNLIKGMEEVGAGNLAYRIEMKGSDEISLISSSFDSMSINLEKQKQEIEENLKKSIFANTSIMGIAEKIRSGDLNIQIDSSKYTGEFKKLVEATHALVEAFLRPNMEAMRIANEFSIGNFSVRYDENADVRGDFKQFKDALNNSGKSVSNSIISIQQQMGELTANAEEVNASTEEVAASVKDVADSSFHVSENAEKCKHGVDQVLKAMEELNTTVNQVAIKSEHVSKLTTDADRYSREGITLADIAEKGMEGITQSTIESKDNMVDITHQMEEIGKIVGLIRDISDQTSLLALNAAIEAARAGEAGLGFAVVADEVKALAQETQVSAENIASIIENLQKRSIQASTAMEKTVKDVESGGKALQDTFQSFTRIAELIEEINVSVTDVAATTEEQAASVEEITASITEIGGLVSNTSKQAELSAHSTNEVAVAVNQISQVIGNLNTIVENVQIQINFFKV